MARSLKKSGPGHKPEEGRHPRRISEKTVMKRWEELTCRDYKMEKWRELNSHLRSAEPICRKKKR